AQCRAPEAGTKSGRVLLSETRWGWLDSRRIPSNRAASRRLPRELLSPHLAWYWAPEFRRDRVGRGLCRMPKAGLQYAVAAPAILCPVRPLARSACDSRSYLHSSPAECEHLGTRALGTRDSA